MHLGAHCICLTLLCLLPCRVEQQELHHARSAVAESWTLLASSEPPTAAIAAAEPPHTEEQQVPESCALTSSFGVGTDMTGPHMTSM